jgi:hypothetical protein
MIIERKYIVQIIKWDNLEKWDYLSIGIYLLLTFFILNPELINYSITLTSIYCFGTIIFLYFINYKSLRKIKVFIVWTIISLFHLYIYNKLGENPNLQMFRGSSLEYLKTTWIALILFQIFRIISLLIFKIELVGPSKSDIDIWDCRQVKWSDKFFFVLYFLIMMSFS